MRHHLKIKLVASVVGVFIAVSVFAVPLSNTASAALDPCEYHTPTRTPVPFTPTQDRGGDHAAAPQAETPCSATYTPTSTDVIPATATATSTLTPTNTHNPFLPTFTPTNTKTVEPTVTPTDRPFDPCDYHTPTRTPTHGPTATGGAERTLRDEPCSATYTPTVTAVIPATHTPEPTYTRTHTETPDFLPTSTFAPTDAPTNVPSLTPSATDTARYPLQLLQNSAFTAESPRLSPWGVTHGPSDRPDDKVKFIEAAAAFFFKGGANEKSVLKQVVSVNGLDMRAGDTLALSVTYNSTGPAPQINAKIAVKYKGSRPNTTVVVPINVTSELPQVISGSLFLEGSKVEKITVTLTNKSLKPKTRVNIDMVELWWLPTP